MARNFRMVGETRLRNQEGNGLINHVAFEVEGGKTTFAADHPNLTHQPKIQASDSPDVARFMRGVAHKMEQTALWLAGRNRPVVSIPKSERSLSRAKRDRRELVPCPACGGTGDFMCALCEGTGAVLPGHANEWSARVRERFNL